MDSYYNPEGMGDGMKLGILAGTLGLTGVIAYSLREGGWLAKKTASGPKPAAHPPHMAHAMHKAKPGLDVIYVDGNGKQWAGKTTAIGTVRIMGTETQQASFLETHHVYNKHIALMPKAGNVHSNKGADMGVFGNIEEEGPNHLQYVKPVHHVTPSAAHHA